MENRLAKSVVAGIVATAVMTVVGMLAPVVGLPKMDAAAMLSGMLGTPLAIGWIMHFMIGIFFAAIYVYWFNPTVEIHNAFLKGLAFGFAVFVFAQLMLLLIGLMMPMPGSMETNMALMMIASLIGHLVYGVFTAWTVAWLSKSVESGHGHKTFGTH